MTGPRRDASQISPALDTQTPGRRGAAAPAAGGGRGRVPALPRYQARAALHRAAPALQRSHAGETPGGRWRGRPSTYASILSTIQEREYVGKEGGRFVPQRVGHGGDRSAARSFDDIFDVTITRRAWKRAGRNRGRQARLARRHGGVLRALRQRPEARRSTMTNIKRMEKPTDLTCEKCGKPLVIKWGQSTAVSSLAPATPNAPTRRELTVDLPDVDKADLSSRPTKEYCENCGRPMVLKKGRFGTSTRARDTPTARPPSLSAASRRSPTSRSTRSAAVRATTWR